mgnify:CR=1 FL=1
MSLPPSLDCISSSKPDRRADFKAALSRRDYAINLIGIENFDRFEEWAFKMHSIVYDKNISFLWSNAHSTKGMPEDPDEAIKTIIKLWVSRHTSEAKEDVFFFNFIDQEFPGPGLDSDEDYNG